MFPWDRPARPPAARAGDARARMVTAETRELGFVVETAAAQGGRKHMEDEAVVARVGDPVGRQVLLVGVFDGHCGGEASAFLRKELPRLVDAAFEARPAGTLPEVAQDAFLAADRAFLYTAKREAVNAGSTCTCLLIEGDAAAVAWVGDSDAYRFHPGALADPAERLTQAHRPDRPDEKLRVELAGGTVIKPFGSRVFRVCGTLAMSRSIGDKNLKPIVTAAPETVQVPSGSSVFVLASDGVWDVLNGDDVVAAWTAGGQAGGLDGGVAGTLVREAAGRGSGDNCICAVVRAQ